MALRIPSIPHANTLVYVFSILLIFQFVYYESRSNQVVSKPAPPPTFAQTNLRQKELIYAEEIYKRSLNQRAISFVRPAWADPEFNEKTYWIRPLYPCFGEERIGGWMDGGKWVCRLKDYLGKPAVVYSIGSDGNDDFEFDIWQKLKIKTFTFDPTLNTVKLKKMKKLEYVHFYEIGLTHHNDLKAAQKYFKHTHYISKHSKFMRLDQIMKQLHHPFVDILKIDCEGCEKRVFQRIFQERPRHQPLFGQILMELHSFNTSVVRDGFMKTLEDMGYRLFHAEANYFYSEGFELSYIHESLVKPAMEENLPN